MQILIKKEKVYLSPMFLVSIESNMIAMSLGATSSESIMRHKANSSFWVNAGIIGLILLAFGTTFYRPLAYLRLICMVIYILFPSLTHLSFLLYLMFSVSVKRGLGKWEICIFLANNIFYLDVDIVYKIRYNFYVMRLGSI